MASLKQIAKEMGVSVATVSNVLTGKGRVSEDMSARIKAYAQAIGYKPSVFARALKTGQSGVLGLVMPDLTNPLFPRIAQSLSIAAEQRGLGILIGDSRGNADRQREAIHWLADRGVDGVLIVPQKGTSPEVPDGLPNVIINTASDPRSAVAADHVGGGTLLGRHISELGHTHVALLGGDPVSEVQQDRIKGMIAGLGPDVTCHTIWGDDGLARLCALAAEGVSAVMATSDLLALGAHSRLSQAGVRVPADISLTGFDDLPLALAMHPALTTVAQDMDTIATYALRILTDRIAQKPDQTQGVAVPMQLVLRASTTRAPTPTTTPQPNTEFRT